jgi:hypothetical protein
MFLLVIEAINNKKIDYHGCHGPHQHKSIWNWQEQDQVSWNDIQAFQISEGEKQEGS